MVDFADLSTGDVTSWEWTFGDGLTSIAQHPSHQYAEPGLYTVALTVSGLTGSDTETKHNYIFVPTPPVAGIACGPPRGTAPLTVDFRDMSGGQPASWHWDFGDGSVSTQRSPTHVYADPGRYTVSLTATSEWGSSTLVCDDLITVTFADVPFEHWACNGVLTCICADIVVGYPDGLYRPDWGVTRDQMAVYISRGVAGGDTNVPTGPAEATFPDVPTTHWAYNHIEYAAAQEIVEGYEDGTYHPDDEVTRDQMAVYVARSICDPTGEDGLADYVPADPRSFPDVPSDFWSYKHVEYCVEQGVVQGYEDGLYHPEIVVTRDQMAVYVARAFGLGG